VEFARDGMPYLEFQRFALRMSAKKTGTVTPLLVGERPSWFGKTVRGGIAVIGQSFDGSADSHEPFRD